MHPVTAGGKDSSTEIFIARCTDLEEAKPTFSSLFLFEWFSSGREKSPILPFLTRYPDAYKHQTLEVYLWVEERVFYDREAGREIKVTARRKRAADAAWLANTRWT